MGFEPSVKNDFSRIFAIGLEKKDYCFGLPMTKVFRHKNTGGAIRPFAKTIDNGHVFHLVLKVKKPQIFQYFELKTRKMLGNHIIKVKKRENCVVSQLHVVKICKNFNVLVFKTRHFT